MFELTIGDMAKLAASKVQTIRYYEEIGLLREPVRNAGNQRRYDQAALARLKFIRHSRELGFSLEDIRNLLTMSDQPDHNCAAADSLAHKRLVDVESRIIRLQAIKLELERMIDACSGGKVAQCRVIEVLANHKLCTHSEH